MPRTPFAAGEACLLYDAKGRRYLIELIAGASFQYHRGLLPHDDIIGTEEGTRFESSMGSHLLALRPRLADYVLKMGRGATVVYPKDAAAIVMWADIGPGHTVLEAGTGSGGLAMVLARAVDPGGRVVSIERREDHHDRARKLIRGFYGAIPDHLDLRLGDVEDAVADVEPDRLVLDLPEPWHTVPAAVDHLAPGGVFCCYLPTVPQVRRCVPRSGRRAVRGGQHLRGPPARMGRRGPLGTARASNGRAHGIHHRRPQGRCRLRRRHPAHPVRAR